MFYSSILIEKLMFNVNEDVKCNNKPACKIKKSLVLVYKQPPALILSPWFSGIFQMLHCNVSKLHLWQETEETVYGEVPC